MDKERHEPRQPERQSLSEFSKDAAGALRRMSRSRRPLVLTRAGKPAGVVLTPAEYKRLSAARRQAGDLRAVREGLAQADRGEGSPAREVLARLQRLAAGAGPRRKR